MIFFDNTKLVKALENQTHSRRKIAAIVESSEITLKKIIEGSDNLRLSSLTPVADYLGLDVQITFIPRKTPKLPSRKD